MRYDKLRWLSCLSVFAFPALAYAEDCSIWSTVLDKSVVLSNNHDYLSEQHHFCDVTQSSESYNDARSQAIGAGIPVPFADGILDFKFDGKSASQSSSFKDWRRQYCAADSYQKQSDSDISKLLQTFSDNALEAAKACYSLPGLKGRITVSRDHKVVFIEANYKKYANEKEILDRAKIVPAAAVSGCDPNDLFKNSNGKEIKNLNVACQWDSTKSFSVQLNTKTQLSKWPALTLSADAPPVPEPVPVCQVPVKVYNTSAINRTSLQANCPQHYHVIDNTGDCETTSPPQSGLADPPHGKAIGKMAWRCNWPLFSPEGVGLTVEVECGLDGDHKECLSLLSNRRVETSKYEYYKVKDYKFLNFE